VSGEKTAVGDHKSSPILTVRGLTKEYPGVTAVSDVSFSVEHGAVHCLVGENGAGKSTLVKMLTGAVQPTSGTMELRGVAYRPGNPADARQGGLATLFQELHVVNELTVQENLTLGMERSRFGFLVKSDLDRRVVETLAAIEPSIDPSARVSTLSVAQKQIVEITRAASSGASVIIMDEPTAALSKREVERLFEVIRRLREQAVTVIYISHKLDEIFELGDAVTVLRDGKHIATKPLSDVSGRSELIEMMIGRALHQDYSARPSHRGNVVLEATGLSNDVLDNVSFEIMRGEIVGFYGLVGSGKSEIARALFGADAFSGTVKFKGRVVGRSPRHAIRSGIALVPEERRTQGLFTSLTIRRNITAMNLRRVSVGGVIGSADEQAASTGFVRRLRIATDTIEKHAEKLSGGNQQKVVLAKCLFADAELMLLDEPTRGVDVGAKKEIYDVIRHLADEGTSIAVFSSELEEVLGLCNRIFLLFSGSLVAEVANGANVDMARILNIVTGGTERVAQ
jgi:ribose transport system ATP-binding protein